MKHSRQSYLDAMRGIAALIVVVLHYFAAFYPYAVFGNQGSYQQQANWQSIFLYPPAGIIIAGHFAVSLFFILSGYVLSYGFFGENNCKSRILAAATKRPARLGGLVLFTVLVASSLWYNGLFFNATVSELTQSTSWFMKYWMGDLNFYELFINVTTSLFSTGNKYNPPLWSISIELYGSIIVFAFVFLFGKFRYRLILLVALLILFNGSFYQGFFLGMIVADVNKHHLSGITSRFREIFSYAIIFPGIYFASYPYYVDAKTLSKTVYGVLPELTLLGGGYSMFGAFLIFIFVIANSQIKVCLGSRILQFLGRISYAVYVMHFLILGSISSYLFVYLNTHLGYTLSFVIVFLFSLLLIIILSYFATKYIDDPAVKLAARIGMYTMGQLKKPALVFSDAKQLVANLQSFNMFKR